MITLPCSVIVHPCTNPAPARLVPTIHDPMALDKLASLHGNAPTPHAGRRPRRVPAVLLPVGLLFAFIAIFLVMFGGRLLPALEVRVAPVIALRTISDNSSPEPSATGESPAAQNPNHALTTGQLLFQASGWVEPDPYITNVPTLVDGVVNEILVLEGQTVQKNQLLATLIDDDARLDVEGAERRLKTLDATQVAHCAELPVLNAEMHALQQTIASERAFLAELGDSARRLASVPKGSVPALEVEQARLKVERQQALVDEANAKLAGILAKINKVDLERLAVNARISEAQTDLSRKNLALARTRITAPIDGIVLHLHAAPGKKRRLAADDPASALIVELYDPQNLQARIDVPLSEASGLRVGQPVRLSTDLLPDSKFNGEVTRIVGEADLQRNTLQAKVRIINPDPRLRPEMLVRAEFFPGGKASPKGPGSPPETTPAARRLSLYAPSEALINLSDHSAQAWIAEGHQARLRDLEVGTEERDDHLLIHEGLHPGDQVILPPHEKLKPGKRIRFASDGR